MYGIESHSAIINAAAPSIGGVIPPPVDAAASIAAATWGLNPVFFIRGIVILPVPTTLAVAAPLRLPINALLTTAA